MKDTQCRLCSSTSSLISLFSGKSRKNRDIIRKLTFETVHIQVGLFLLQSSLSRHSRLSLFLAKHFKIDLLIVLIIQNTNFFLHLIFLLYCHIYYLQFEEGDVYACICYSCVTQVYNFYIFKIRSQENDKRLQVSNF